MGDQLPIGRIALARSAFVDWIFEHAKVVLGLLAALVLFLFGAAHLSQSSVKKGYIGGMISPYYAEFVRVSSWMKEEQWDRALEATRAIQQKMKKDEFFWNSQDALVHSGGVLYFYNLLRLVTLERKAGSTEGELRAINELLASVDHPGPKESPLDAEACAIVSSAFQDGALSLRDYLYQRKQEAERLAIK